MHDKLSCGGKGPCCHVGYSHRHCEHCDQVIDTRQLQWTYPVLYPTYPVYPSVLYPTYPVYPSLPYYPWYSGGMYGTAGLTSGTHAFTTTAGDSTTSGHACNVFELPQENQSAT